MTTLQRLRLEMSLVLFGFWRVGRILNRIWQPEPWYGMSYYLVVCDRYSSDGNVVFDPDDIQHDA